MRNFAADTQIAKKNAEIHIKHILKWFFSAKLLDCTFQ